jgi:hypothetical protein
MEEGGKEDGGKEDGRKGRWRVEEPIKLIKSKR